MKNFHHYSALQAIPRKHVFGAHGVLLAVPVAALLWSLIAAALLGH